MELKDLMPAIIAILLIGLALGIGMFTMAEVRTQVATDHAGTDNNINLTLAAGTTTLADSTKDDYALSAVTAINSSGSTIPATTYYNFTSAGVITWGVGLYDGSSAYYSAGEENVNVSSTFTYDKANSAEEGIGDAIDGIGNFSGWIAVIVVVLSAAIVLGIVLRSFGKGSSI